MRRRRNVRLVMKDKRPRPSVGAAARRRSASGAWRPSRFNLHVREPDGTLLVFNSYSSAFLRLTGGPAETVAAVLEGRGVPRGELAEFLARNGVVVPANLDELARATAMHEAPFTQDESLELILMPNENCNFRCVYCYEDFKKNRMLPDVVAGILALLDKRVPALRHLSLNWFGGEPLLSFDIVERIATHARELCAVHGVRFSSQMTTNGYYLDAERASRCIAAGIVQYQVTLDGPAETHDAARHLAGGGATYAKILANLRTLRDRAQGFRVWLRVNFSPANLPKLPEFVRFLGREFGNDPRFSVGFFAVGRWGGPNDARLTVCDHRDAEDHSIELTAMAQEAGFNLDPWRNAMQPFGSSCYAANPRSFVIGSDGMVYKCTVVFNNPRNQVGRLDADGTLHLTTQLVELWTRSGEETDSGCRECGFRPACQGNHCPLERLDGLEKRCPPPKTHIAKFLPLLAGDALRALPVVS